MTNSFPEWVTKADLSASERNLISIMQSNDFPFKWYDPTTANSAIVNYTRLCPTDPFGLGPHRTRLLFDVLSKYTLFHACETARQERERSVQRSIEKLARKNKTKAVQAATVQNKRMKSAAPFALWLLSNLPHGNTDFNGAFISLFERGRLTEKALKGNVKTALIGLMPVQHAAFICEAYNSFYNERLILPRRKETL